MARYCTEQRTYLYVRGLNIFQVNEVCKCLNQHYISFTVKIDYRLEDRNIYIIEADVTNAEYSTIRHLDSLNILE